MTAPNIQVSGSHNLYLAVKSLANTAATYAHPKAVTNFADGTDGSGGSGLTDGILEIISGSLFVRSQNVRDLNEDGTENRVDVTTRADSSQGLSSEFIATTSAGFNYVMIYKGNDPAAADVLKGFTDIAFRALLLARNRTDLKEIYAIDMDREFDFATATNNQGIMGQAGNWTIGLTRAKPVQGVVEQTAQFALSSFGEWLVHDGTKFVRLGDEVAVP